MAKSKTGVPVVPPDLTKLRDEAVARQTQITGQIQQLQAAAQQLVGQLNQVAGEIKAIDAIMGAK